MLLQYFRTQEFENIVESIDHIANVRHMYQYLDESGLNIYRIDNVLRRVINLPEIQSRRILVKVIGGNQDLFSDVQGVFLMREFIAWYKEKMQSDPIYKVFIGRIHLDQFKDVVGAVIFDHDFAAAAAELRSSDSDVEFFIGVVRNLLNFHSSVSLKRSFKEDMDDFIHLMPLDEIAKITFGYVLYDAQVQEAVRYIRSQEFQELAIKLQQDPEVFEFLKYFEDSGAHAIDFINILNELLDIPSYPLPENFLEERDYMGGVKEMLKDIRAIIPFDAIEAMYKDKMKNSKEFRYFIERIHDSAFQKITDKMVSNENVIELGYQAQCHGIDINMISQFLTQIFGIKLPETPLAQSNSSSVGKETSLSEDFEDFFNLLPIDAILEVAADYILNDEELQAVFVYIRSEQFQNVIRSLHEIPEYEQILVKLEAAGVDIKSVIGFLHELIDFESFHTRDHFNSVDATKVIEKPGLSGFIETVKELLPYKEIKALYQDKLETSKAFAEFIGLISSETFQTLTNKLFRNEDFQDLLHEALAHGVDLQSVSDFFLRVFGIKTPPGIIDL